MTNPTPALPDRAELTEAAERYILSRFTGLDGYTNDFDGELAAREAFAAAEAEAVANALLDAAEARPAQDALLREALEWAMAPDERYEGRHRLRPNRCSVFMPTDSDCDCGYEKAAKALTATPPASAERDAVVVTTTEEYVRESFRRMARYLVSPPEQGGDSIDAAIGYALIDCERAILDALHAATAQRDAGREGA